MQHQKHSDCHRHLSMPPSRTPSHKHPSQRHVVDNVRFCVESMRHVQTHTTFKTRQHFTNTRFVNTGTPFLALKKKNTCLIDTRFSSVSFLSLRFAPTTTELSRSDLSRSDPSSFSESPCDNLKSLKLNDCMRKGGYEVQLTSGIIGALMLMQSV